MASLAASSLPARRAVRDRRVAAAPAGLARQRGLALLTILLLLVLVTAIGLMALTVGEMEITLAGTNRRTTQTLHAASGGGEIAVQAVRDTLETNALPTGYPPTVAINSATSAGNPSLPDLVEKLTTGSVSTTSPDITVTAFPNQTVRVDANREGYVELSGSEFGDFASAYHRKTGGTGCTSGSLYYIDSVASGPLKSRSNVGLAYFHCQ